ncbi:MAG: hypothetical protein ACHQUC_07275 [Chlamydiales bacterium]
MKKLLLTLFIVLSSSSIFAYPFQYGPLPKTKVSSFLLQESTSEWVKENYSTPISKHSIVQEAHLLKSNINTEESGWVMGSGDYPIYSHKPAYRVEISYQLDLTDSSTFSLEVESHQFANRSEAMEFQSNFVLLPNDELNLAENYYEHPSTARSVQLQISREGKRIFSTFDNLSNAYTSFVLNPNLEMPLSHLGLAYSREHTYLRTNLDIDGRYSIPDTYFSNLLYCLVMLDGSHQKLWMFHQMFDAPLPINTPYPPDEIKLENLVNYENALELEKYPQVPSGQVTVTKAVENRIDEDLFLTDSSATQYKSWGRRMIRIVATVSLTLADKQVITLNREVVCEYYPENAYYMRELRYKYPNPHFQTDDILEFTPSSYVWREGNDLAHRGRIVEVRNYRTGAVQNWIVWEKS